VRREIRIPQKKIIIDIDKGVFFDRGVLRLRFGGNESYLK
jgi:hypothetical protein